MTPSAALRNRYVTASVATASPERLLCALYDRLVLDLHQAEQAMGESDRQSANAKLQHAQEIVVELRSTLRLDAWSGAPALNQVYGWLLSELVGANLRQDAGRVRAARGLVEPLRDAWYEAAQQVANRPVSAVAGA